jgi:pilus assembly protein CpaE
MTLPKVNVATLSPSTRIRAMLRQAVEATTLASVQLEVDEYCATFGDQPTRKLVQAHPQIILIDMDNPKVAIRALSIIHLELPEAWLFVTSERSEIDSILESVRAGAREFLPQPIEPSALNQALARYITEHRPVHEDGEGTVYCVTPCKEGVGATSLAINIAAALAPLPDTKIALIDMNSPGGDVADYLNLKPQYTVVDALTAVSKLDVMLLETFVSYSHEVAVLPGPKESRPMPVLGREALFQMIQMVAKSYTHTFIDFHSNIDPNYLQVLSEISTAILLVLTPEVPSLLHAGRVSEDARQDLSLR